MMNGTSSFQTMKDSPMLQRTPEWFAVIAALFLATGIAHATADGCSVVLRTPDGLLGLYLIFNSTSVQLSLSGCAMYIVGTVVGVILTQS